MNEDAAGNAYKLKHALRLPAGLSRAANSGAIPSSLALFLLVQERADFLDANEVGATPYP
jgi:hypothetical protein